MRYHKVAADTNLSEAKRRGVGRSNFFNLVVQRNWGKKGQNMKDEEGSRATSYTPTWKEGKKKDFRQSQVVARPRDALGTATKLKKKGDLKRQLPRSSLS